MSGPTDPAEEHFDKGLWGWDLTQWRKLPMLWGYSAGWAEDLSGTQSGAGNYLATTTAVPAGYVYVLQSAMIRNDVNARTRADIYLARSGSNYLIYVNAAPVVAIGNIVNGSWVLMPGDQVLVYYVGCLDGDVLVGGVWGYKMAIGQ